MRTPKTLKEYKDEIDQAINNPGMLARIGLEMSADYGFYSEEYAKLETERNRFFVQKKYSEEKPLSDSACSAFWGIEPQGERWTTIKYYLRGLKEMIKSNGNLNYTANQEAKNIQ